MIRSLLLAICVLMYVCTAQATTPTNGHLTQIVKNGAPDVITIGIVDTFSPEFYINSYSPTIDRLMTAMPQRQFRFVELDYRDVQAAVRQEKPDFIVAAASTFAELSSTCGAHQIGVRKSSQSTDVAHGVSSTFIVRADSPFRTLADLKDRKVAVVSKDSFDGWLIAQGELARQGLDPDKHFSELLETHYTIPDVVTLVMLGVADVGVLMTGQYEMLLRNGLVEPGDLRVIDEKIVSQPAGNVRSTDQYPDAVFASLPWAQSGVVSAMSVALLSISESSLGFRWEVCNDFVPTQNLMRVLAIGPYSYLRDMSIEGLFRRYQTEVVLLGLLTLAVIFHIVTVNILVQRRTRELTEAISTIRKTHEAAEKTNEKLHALERAGVVAQLSSMFAHEIKQPVTNISLYAGALRLYLQKKGLLTDKISDLMNAMDSEISRSSTIVEHVRSYAKKHKRVRCRCDLVQITEESIKIAGALSVIWDNKPQAYVLADPFEVQFVCANIIKNARDAVKSSNHPLIRINIEKKGRNWTLAVTDNGPYLPDEVFDRLGKIASSSKRDGLGFGLAIAFAITEANGGHLYFERAEPHGLRAIALFREFDSTHSQSSSLAHDCESQRQA